MTITTRVALAACLALGAITPASAEHRWGQYHWARTANPLTLTINEALSSKWEPHLAAALADWNRSSVLDFSSASPVPSTASPKRCDPIAGQIQVCNALYGQRGWLGIATIWASGNHITQGTTKLNDTYFNMSRYNTPEWRQFVTCQEIGHDFGLGHQNEIFTNANTGSCMDYTNDPSGKAGTNGSLANTAPNQHDYDLLELIYNHTDTTNTATGSAATNFGVREVGKPAGSPSGDRGVGDTMAEWGHAIHHDAKGRPDIFVRRLPDGRTMISHVFWALEAKGTEAH